MELTLETADFWLPSLVDVAAAVETGLGANYAEARVGVHTCPDLRPLGCAFAGLGGTPFLFEIGDRRSPITRSTAMPPPSTKAPSP